MQPVMRPKGMGLGAAGVYEKGEREQVEEAVKRKEAETRHLDHVGKKWRKKGVVVKKLRWEKEKEEVRRMLRDAKPDALFAAPEVVYNIGMLAEGAVVEMEKARRRVATEELIEETARRETDVIKGEIEQARKAVEVLVEVESVLKSVQTEEQDEVYCEGLTRFVNLVRAVEKVRCMPSEMLHTALADLVQKRAEAWLKELLGSGGRGRKVCRRKAKHVRRVLLIARDGLSADDYLVLCTKCVLQPARVAFLRPDWDAISGAWIADILSMMRDALPDAVVAELAEDVLVPKLVARIEAELRSAVQTVPVHVWVHPWLPVVGRRALVEVLGRVRVWLARRLERWRVEDAQGREELIDAVGVWSGALSRRKIQLALARHVTPKLVKEAGEVCEKAEVVGMETRPRTFKNMEGWSRVTSARMLAAAVAEPVFGGLCRSLRDVVFDDSLERNGDAWGQGCNLYVKWKAWIPGKLLPHLRGGLGALLFILHAAKQADVKMQRYLKGADIGPLLRNRFTAVVKSEKNIKARRESGKNGAKLRSQMSVKDMLLHVAHCEGLLVVGGERHKDGLGLLQVGSVKVAVDGRRGVLRLVRDDGDEAQMPIISVEDIVRLAKRP